METTGIVKRIIVKKNFSFVRVEDGEEVFAHKNHFEDPSLMKVGQLVRLEIIPATIPGKNRIARNVRAA